MNQKDGSLLDKNQTWWQLAAIQLTGWTSLPILATSVLILQGNSFLGAALTIVIGNAILWFIRFGIIAMSYKKRQSTLDISRDYLGNFGSYIIAIVLLFSTLAWFIAQTTTASNTLTHLVNIKENPDIDKFTQMSVFLGVVSTFLCMEGITLLRRLANIAFPILIVVFLVAFLALPSFSSTSNTNTLSLFGLGLVLSTNLGLTADLPTFFRHSESFQSSIKALTFLQIISICIGLASLYFTSVIDSNFSINENFILTSGNTLLRGSLIVLVFLSVICANVANVYSGSVGWEVIAPSALVGRKEYLIIGLGLTTVFIFVSNIFSIEFILNISSSSLVNLCLVLIIGYTAGKITKRPPNFYEQTAYFSAWLFSSTINALQLFNIFPYQSSLLLTGIIIIFLTLIVFYPFKGLVVLLVKQR